MIRFLADEDFDGRIVRGLYRVKSDLQLIRAQDVGLSGASDEKLLEWAADNDRIVLSHDKRTLPRHAHDRLRCALHVPGIFIVINLASIRQCIDDIVLIAECSEPDEWKDRVLYLPFL
jgi:hypothetical protein